MSSDRRYQSDQSAVSRLPASRLSNREAVFCFSILAECEPGVMPRVLELFAKRNMVPDRWISDVGGAGGRELAIDLQVAGLTPDLADYIARCLRGLHYVDRVLLSEKASQEVSREPLRA